MKSEMPMRRVAFLAALVGLAASLAGCQTISQAAGLGKDPPDEFAVVTKAPLVVPPVYKLKPPKPGAAPTNQSSPTATADVALYGNPQKQDGLHGHFSSGEEVLLSKAGAVGASNMIRQQIAADNHAMQTADQSFTNRLLFGLGSSSDNSGGKALNADAEAKRLRENKSGAAQSKPASDSTSIQKDSGGWLDGIF